LAAVQPCKPPTVDGLFMPENDMEKIFNKFPENYKKPLALKKDYE
jgi:hypothetical protein